MNEQLAVDLPSGNETVLVAESDQSHRVVVSWMLGLQGYEVLGASDGIKALVRCQEHGDEDIHLLLTELRMPRMGGIDLAGFMRSARPSTKVIFTAEKSDDVAIGIFAYDQAPALLLKPFSLEELAIKVRQALDE